MNTASMSSLGRLFVMLSIAGSLAACGDGGDGGSVHANNAAPPPASAPAPAPASVGSTLATLALNINNIETAGFSFSVTNDANSTGFYQVLADGIASPTPENLKRNGTAFGITGNQAAVQRIASLLPSTLYNLHFIAVDTKGALQPSIRTLPVQTSRDPLKWPFSSDSIWNMPIGRNAIYSHANLPAVFGRTADETFYFFISGNDDDYLFLNPGAPLTNVYINTAAWQRQAVPHTTGINRCYNRDPVNDVISSTTTSTLLVTVPMPADYIVPSTRGNNGGAFLMPDGRTFKQIQPIARCNAGEPATALVYIRQPSDEDLYGTGITGAHGGSKLSTIGGTLRLGELRPNQPAPRHVLKLDVDSRVVFPKCSNTPGGTLPPCHRWPALVADSGAANPADATSYGYLAQANVNPAMSMGALLALPASLSIDSLNLETEPGRQLAWTLQNYGAYIVDSTGFPSYYFGTESGPDGSFTAQFKRDWGYDFLQRTYTDAERARRARIPPSSDSYTSVESTRWLHDMQKIITALQVVTNNSASNVGGGGVRLQPLAVEIRP
ncbi:hypothetical protein ACO0LF_27120 [Undibacterium sp. Di27W]|uniref:hypothetical protein n=1 Tax=Undibacterium sp. Di27W TaxID=3413036 RepID=UPI003BF1A167